MLHQNCLIPLLLVFINVLLIGENLSAQENEREWVDKSGKFKIEATFQKVETQVVDRTEVTNVFLIRADGAAIKIPLDNLSLNDQAYVRELERMKKLENEVVPKTSVLPKSTPNQSGNKSSGQERKDPTMSGTETLPAGDNPESSPKTTSPPTKDLAAENRPPVLRMESPDSDFEFLNEDSAAFESKIDISEVNQLPAKIREHALVLHKRPNVIDVGQSFYALSQFDSLPPVAVQLIRETSQSNNKYYRIQSLKLLAIFDAVESFDLILDAISDQAFSVRMIALEVLEHLKDPRAVDQLVARFPGRDRSKIAIVLTAYGSSVEEKVFPLLKHQNKTVIADAVRLLEKIGTEKSIEQLTPLLDSKVVIRMQARSSIDNIRKRLGQ